MLSYLSKSLIVLVASIVSISAFTPSSPLQTFRPVVTVTNTHTQPCSINLTPKPIQMTSLQLSSSSSDEDNKEGVLSKLNAWRKKTFAKKSPDDLTFKQKLAKAGLSVLLSYGFVSNMSYTVTVSLAWYVFTKTTQLSPLAPGQWKNFLAVYAGFYVFNNIIRPIRFGIAATISVYFDKIIAWMQAKLKCSKGVAIGVVVFLANIVGTTTLMCLGISLASAATGVPIFVKK